MAAPARKPDLQLVSPSVPPARLLDHYIGLFLEAKSGKAEKTLAHYRSILYLFRNFTGAFLWPVTPEAIDAFLNDCRQRGLKQSTIVGYYRALKIWLNWLVLRGKIEASPIDRAERPASPKLLPRAPQIDHLRKLFHYFEKQAQRGHWLDIRALAIWSLALDTGLRVGELMALAVSDVTIEKRNRRAFVRGRKTYTDRVVFFSKETGKDVKHWIQARAGLPLPPGIEALFVCYDKGRWRALTSWGARQALTRRCAELNLPHITPHQFRNAYAVFSIRNRMDLLDIQRQMGHSSIQITARYTLVGDDPARGKRHQKHSPRKGL